MKIEMVISTLLQTHTHRGVFLGVSHPQPKRVGPQRSPRIGVPFIYAYTLWRRSDVVRRLFFCQPQARTKGAEPQHFPICGVFLYLWLRSLKKNDQSLRGNIHGKGLLVFRQSAMPSIPRRRGRSGFCGFTAAYAYTVRPRTSKFGVVTHIGRGRVCHAIAFAQMRRAWCG